MAARKTVAVSIGLVLLLVGLVLFMITEPAGSPGSPWSGGVADVSDETRPYLIPAIVLLLVGAVVFLAAALGKL